MNSQAPISSPDSAAILSEVRAGEGWVLASRGHRPRGLPHCPGVGALAVPNTEPDSERQQAPKAEAAGGSERREPRGHSAGNPSPLRAGRTRPGLWPLRCGPGCSCRAAAAAAPGKRRPALTAGQSLLPAPKVLMEEQTSGPDRARGYLCGSGQDCGARGLAAAAPAPPSPPPFSSNSSSSSSPWVRPQTVLPALPPRPPLSRLRGHPLKGQPLSFPRAAVPVTRRPAGH